MLSLLPNIHLKEVADQNKKGRTPRVSDAVERQTKKPKNKKAKKQKKGQPSLFSSRLRDSIIVNW